MKTKSTLFILLVGLVLASDAAARILVATNSAWRYFKGAGDQGLPPAGQKWLTVAAVTMTSQTNTEANLQTFFSYMERAASNGVDLIVFPEVALQGCPGWREDSSPPSVQEMAYTRQTAETIPGPSTSNVVAKAKELNLFVVFGMTEKDAAGPLYNANVFLGPQGVIGKHRKTFHVGNDGLIWSLSSGFEVLASPLGKIGLMICAETALYPGPALASQGAGLLVTSSAWWTSVAYNWDRFTVGNAVQSRRWHVVSQQVGPVGHVQVYGHSRVIDPTGTIVCDGGQMEGLVIWTTDILIDARPFEDRPFITSQPTNQAVWAGTTASFTLAAYSYQPMTYQWQFNAAPINGATNASLTLTNLQAGHAGTYTVIIADPRGSVTSAPTVLTILFDPIIVQQPSSVSARLGTTASFTVAAYSPLPMTYQWQFNAAPINGATNASFTLANLQAVHAGTYTVIIADPRGSVTSAPTVLTILFDPIIVQQPCSVTVPQGGSVTLSVQVTNTATLPIGYRWRRGTTSIAHALVNEYVNFLTLTNCQATTNYEVIITNLARPNIRSSTAVVTVLPDIDGDGLPDSWELACGLCQTNLHHGRADDDGDGRSNLQEYLAGTDPTNALSYLKVEDIASADGGTALLLRFVAVSNLTYTVRYRDVLHTGEWTRLADVAAGPTNRMVELRDSAVPNGPQRFYRLLTPGNPSP